ncbi:uncharacterized protein ARMOST_12921 [Armillaria ostoyae]|uniref:Uncharacterized protein n=1 Tax=Armillaria ostoyae TaxID=47428 RepID=A0A284RLB3_ARMOS|nr:uncharacterized protein ARMOST_12921 [Armillaria ostoyae]
MPKSTYERAEPDGTAPIIHSRATKLYNLTPTDLQSISPVRQERNPHGGWVTYYNTGDVERLQRSLQGRSATRKKAGGPKIIKTDALNIFNLKEWDLRSLTPEVKPHPKYKGRVMYLYDREEVEAIAKRAKDDMTACQEKTLLNSFVAIPASSTPLPLALAANHSPVTNMLYVISPYIYCQKPPFQLELCYISAAQNSRT